MEADYDKLSAIGEEQARKLGEYWVRHRITYQRVVHGPAKRHIRTMEIAGDLVRAAGMPWPEPQAVAGFDEFDAFTVMSIMLPALQKSNTVIRRLSVEFEQAKHTPEAGRRLQKLFEEVAREWASGRHETPAVEDWQQFRARIRTSVEAVMRSSAPSTNTAVFTSGGPIAATIGLTLGLDALQTMEFVWLSRNASYSQFLYSGERMSLHSFNAIPHLDDLSLFTYR